MKNCDNFPNVSLNGLYDQTVILGICTLHLDSDGGSTRVTRAWRKFMLSRRGEIFESKGNLVAVPNDAKHSTVGEAGSSRFRLASVKREMMGSRFTIALTLTTT